MSPPSGNASHAVAADKAMEEAFEWQVTVWSREATPQELDELNAWRALRPENEAAWQRLQNIDRRFRSVPGEIARTTLSPGPTLSRRDLLRSFGALAIVAPAAYTIYGSREWKRQFADYSAGFGERRDIRLADGTRVVLNSGSAINVAFDVHHRRITLEVGEVYIETAVDTRPFIVDTQHGQASPIGTMFSVRSWPDHSRVAVQQGAVQVSPLRNPIRVHRVDAGQQISFDEHSILAETTADASATAWTRGQLVIERMRLAEVLDELGRYRRGFIQCAPSVADRIVSGVFPIDDTDRVLESLGASLGLRVRYRSRFWVIVDKPA